MQPILYFLPMILFLGIITSYEDIKENKIKNKWIITGLTYSLIINLILFLLNKINTEYVLYLLISVFFSIILGIMLWSINFWSAGDSKLFITYSSLVPLSYFSLGFIDYAPSITIMVNMLFISLFYFIYSLFFKTDKKQMKMALKESLNPKEILSSLLLIFGIIWVLDLILPLIGIRNNLLIFAIYFVSFILVRKLFEKRILEIGICLSALRLIFDKNVFSFSTLHYIVFLLLFWLIFIKFVMILSNHVFTSRIKTRSLKADMELAKNIEIKSGKNKTIIKNSKKLSKEEIRKIKNLKKIKYALIKQSIAFAPFMLLGVLATIIAKGNFIIFLRLLF